jgi:PAS domain S-box-containing protein
MPATLTVDTTGQICTWSREAEELLGYSASEAVGQSVEIIIPHHLRHRHGAGFTRFVQTGISALPEVVTTIAVHKTGKLMAADFGKGPLRRGPKDLAVEATFCPPRDEA